MKTFFFTLRASIECDTNDAERALDLVVSDLQTSLSEGDAIPVAVQELQDDGMTGEPRIVHFHPGPWPRAHFPKR